ncbi:MAG: selenium metabolism-associated LysR family transcriptional regulator [Desulfuromonadales bacterium]
MTLKQLEVFVAIADTNSFSRGADRCCITQSTASQHIQALEAELGARLFDRGRGGAQLTEAGKIFARRTRKILADCDDARLSVRQFMGMENVVLRIGASNVPGTWLLPSVAGQFLQEQPKVRLEILQGDSRSVARQLTEEEVELGFVGGRFDDERLVYEPMGGDSIVCAAASRFFEGRSPNLTQVELCSVPLIVREDGSGTQKAVYEALAGTWISRQSLNIAAVLGSTEGIRRALLDGVGYGFISRMSIEDDVARGALTIARIPGVEIYRNFYAVRRKERELSPAASAFLKLTLSRWA